MASASAPSSGAEQQAPASPRPSNLEVEAKSPTGSFTWMARQAKSPSTLLVASPEPDSLPRKAGASFSGSQTQAGIGARSQFSPKQAKQEDPMLAWPLMSNTPSDVAACLGPSASPKGTKASFTAGPDSLSSSASNRSASMPGTRLSPPLLSLVGGTYSRQTSLDAIAIRSPHPIAAAVAHSPIFSLDRSRSCSLSPRVTQLHHSADWPAGLSSCTGVNTSSSFLDICKQRHEHGSRRSSSMSQIPLLPGEHLQSQTHAALQQLSIKEPGRGRDHDAPSELALSTAT